MIQCALFEVRELSKEKYMSPIRVVLADDRVVFRKGIRDFLLDLCRFVGVLRRDLKGDFAQMGDGLM